MKASWSNNRFQSFFNRQCQFVHHLWVAKMDTLTKGLSRKELVYCLIAFTVFSGSFFIYKIVQVFSEKAPISFKIPTVSKPSVIEKKNRELISIESSISKIELKRISSFRDYLDSLSNDTHGRSIYDSIQMKRPGLLDSMVFIEKYYNINFKK